AAVLHRATAGITHPNVQLRVDNTTTAGSELTTLLVRATQELITNTIRHATGASTLHINIERDELASTLVLCAHDDGWAPRNLTLGNGLRGMRERTESLGGQAEFSRSDEGSLLVRLEVPI